MADNVTIGSGDSVAADDIAGAKYQRVKLVHGADGVNAGDVAMANGFPVQPATGTTFPITDNGGSITVDGTVAVSGSVAVTGAFYQATQPVSIAASVAVTGPLTDAELRASAVPVSLASVPSHAVTNAGTFAVQASQSGTWNVTNISGTVSLPTGAATEAKQPALGTAGTASSDVITVQGVTGMTAVKVDGSAVTQPVSGTFWQATQPVSLASVPSHAVTNAGTFAVQDSQGVTDNAAFTDGTTKLFCSGYIYDEVAGTALTENDAAAARINVNRAQIHILEDGTTRGRYATITASNALKVDGSAVTQPVSGTFWQTTQPVSIATAVPVTDNSGSLTVDNAGTFAVQASGDVAHGSSDSGNPVKVGAKTRTSPKGVTLTTDGQRIDAIADADGIPIVKLGTSGADCISESVSNTDGNSTAFTNFSAVLSTKNAITAYSIFRTDAGTSMAYVDFRDGTAGSVIWRVPLPPNGGANLSLGGQPIFKTSANTALAYDVSSALTTVYICVSGFQTKV